jgi:hypothetical protein
MDEDPRQALVVRWLTIMWLAAVAFCLSDYWSVDITNHRKDANWREIWLGIGMATGIYVVLMGLSIFAWSAGRVIVLLAAVAASLFLVPLAGLMGLFAAWAYNLVGYLLVVLVAYCGVHLAFRCMVAPKARRGSS